MVLCGRGPDPPHPVLGWEVLRMFSLSLLQKFDKVLVKLSSGPREVDSDPSPGLRGARPAHRTTPSPRKTVWTTKNPRSGRSRPGTTVDSTPSRVRVRRDSVSSPSQSGCVRAQPSKGVRGVEGTEKETQRGTRGDEGGGRRRVRCGTVCSG